MKRMRCWVMCLFALAVAAAVPSYGQKLDAPANGKPTGRPAIVSPSHPKDSRGETVYEIRGRDEQGQPAVAGAFMPPAPIHRGPIPEYPENMREKKEDGDVIVEGTVAQDGQFIDLTIFKTTEPAFNENSIKAAAKYSFRPATLDGKPVACLLRVAMTFRIH